MHAIRSALPSKDSSTILTQQITPQPKRSTLHKTNHARSTRCCPLLETFQNMKRKADDHREQPPLRTLPLMTYNSWPQYGAGAGRIQGPGKFRVESTGRGSRFPPPPRGTFQHGCGFPRGPPRGTFYGGPRGARHPRGFHGGRGPPPPFDENYYYGRGPPPQQSSHGPSRAQAIQQNKEIS